MDDQTKGRTMKLLAAGTVAVAVGGYVIYKWMATPKQEKSSQQQPGTVTSDGFSVIEVKVPKDSVGAIIGRQGCNIKQIQAETKTKVDFDKKATDESEERIIKIRGSEKGVTEAEMRILHIVYGQPVRETKTLNVPQKCVGKIIGRGGAVIKQLQEDSSCKINVNSRDTTNQDGTDAMCKITFIGETKQIEQAVARVTEIVDQYEVQMNKTLLLKSKQGRRTQPVKSVIPNTSGAPLHSEIWPNHSDFLQVYVTATENPEHVWVQPITPSSTRLEEINDRLKSYYSDLTNLEELPSDYIPVRSAVAALHPQDHCWYRGKIVEYCTNTEHPEQTTVDIYYHDYGDSSWIQYNKNNVQLLRPEYYDLLGQAINCFTTAVNLTDSERCWNESQCDLFDKLTSIGEWKVLYASKVGYKSSKPGSDEELPVIKLVDTSTGPDVDIVEALLQQAQQYSETTSDNNETENPVHVETNPNNLNL